MKIRTPDLPVYCINAFRENDNQHRSFDIKVLERLVGDFHIASQPHRHDFYNILFVTAGSGVHTIDFVDYAVQPCSVFFLTPGQMHALNLSTDAKGFSLFFTPQFMQSGAGERKPVDLPFFHSFNNVPYLYADCLKDNSIRTALDEIIAESANMQTESDHLIRSYLDIILTKLARYYKQAWLRQQSAAVTYQLRELEALLDRHFKKVRLPREYAEMMHISPKHLNEICKKGLNKTLSDLIQDRVILEAKRLLTDPKLTVTQIAQKLNFSDRQYFLKVFKKHLGVTPDQFRERL